LEYFGILLKYLEYFWNIWNNSGIFGIILEYYGIILEYFGMILEYLGII
jgi:hypothetical protein